MAGPGTLVDTPVKTPISPWAQLSSLGLVCRTGRSVDSGYGSIDTSPASRPYKPTDDRITPSIGLSLYDGTSSEESTSEPFESDVLEHETLRSPVAARERRATLPRMSRRQITRTESYPMTPVSRGLHHRGGSDTTAVNESRAGSVRALDRFVPIRDHTRPSSEKLRTTRALNDLSPSERLVRHNQDAPDPFYFRRRALPPSPTKARKARRPSQSGTVLAATSDNQPERRAVSSLSSKFHRCM